MAQVSAPIDQPYPTGSCTSFAITTPPIASESAALAGTTPRFHRHFTPTSASAEHGGTFLRDLTQNRLRRGVFRDLEELIMAIGTYIDRHNESPKPFIWTARAADILEKVKRAPAD